MPTGKHKIARMNAEIVCIDGKVIYSAKNSVEMSKNQTLPFCFLDLKGQRKILRFSAGIT